MTQGRKKKKLPPLENGLQETHVVQKSKPLFSLWTSELTLAEFKILDIYISRINSHKPEQRSVTFEKGKLEEILGVKKINRKDLDIRLENLQKTLVNISHNEKIDRITLFERTQGEQDDNGVWKVTMTCTPSAMKYIFNVEKLGYLRYQIRCITQISSLYSYILFTYLEYNRFRKSWEVSLEELKTILNCESESYNAFKEFNRCILKRCQAELYKKTELRYIYEPIKAGRKVVAIKFTIETLPEIETNQLSFNNENPPENTNDRIALLSDACNNEFSSTQIEEIFQNICNLELPETDFGIDIARYHYVSKMYSKLNSSAERAIAKGKPIKDRYKYFLALIQKQ